MVSVGIVKFPVYNSYQLKRISDYPAGMGLGKDKRVEKRVVRKFWNITIMATESYTYMARKNKYE